MCAIRLKHRMPSLQWIGKGERKKDRTRTPKPWQLHGPIISACLFFNLQFALKTNFDRQIFDAPTTSKDDVMWCGRKVREKNMRTRERGKTEWKTPINLFEKRNHENYDELRYATVQAAFTRI